MSEHYSDHHESIRPKEMHIEMGCTFSDLDSRYKLRADDPSSANPLMFGALGIFGTENTIAGEASVHDEGRVRKFTIAGRSAGEVRTSKKQCEVLLAVKGGSLRFHYYYTAYPEQRGKHGFNNFTPPETPPFDVCKYLVDLATDLVPTLPAGL